MAQENGIQNGGDNKEGENKQANGKPIWSTTGTALAIQIFLIILFLLWVFIPDYVTNPSDAAKAFLESMFSLAIVIVVIVHAMMYYQQAEAMNAQLGATQETITQNRHALEISERAYLGIHSIDGNIEIGRILINIENLGKLPATDIEVSFEGEATIPRQYVTEAYKTPPWKSYIGGLRLTWQLPIDYGNTQLLAGHFPLSLPISLDRRLNRSEREAVKNGRGKLIFSGRIRYHDGFRGDHETVFAFQFSKDEDRWIHYPIGTPGQVWAKWREEVEEHFDGVSALKSYPTTRGEVIPAKTKSEDKDEGQNPN